MFENKSHFDIKTGSEKNFGIVFSVFFIIIALYPLLNNGPIRYWAIITSFILFVISFLFPKILILPNLLWLKFGLVLGKIVSPLIMFLIFFTTVTPIAIIMRFFLKKDLLNQKVNKSAKNYWIKRKSYISNMKNQF